MIHEINLKSYQAVCDSPNNLLDLGTSGSYGIEQLHVTADSAWDGLVLTAVFTNGASTEVPVVSGVADVPPEATAYPTHAGRRFGRIVFKGCDAGGAVRLISNAMLYTIADSGEIDGENTIAPTHDQYAQFVAEVTAEADRAEAAANRAESAGSTVSPEQIAEAVNSYLDENPVQPTAIDATLTQSGQAADAAAVGDRLSALSEEIAAIPSGKDGADGKSAYQYAVDGGYTGTETEFAEKMAAEMPDKLPNPNALTFTGAATGSYDGSEPLSVEIPAGGSGSYTLPVASATQLGGVKPAEKTDEMTQAVGVDESGGLWALPGGEKDWTKICGGKITEEVASIVIDANADGTQISDLDINEMVIMGKIILTGNSGVRYEYNGLWTAGNYFSHSNLGAWGLAFIIHIVRYLDRWCVKYNGGATAQVITPTLNFTSFEMHTETDGVLFGTKTDLNVYYR